MMPTYDVKLIGKCLAWVGEHFVYEYSDDKVIKFSKFDRFIGTEKSIAKFLHDYELSHRYFGEYLLKTDLYSSVDGTRTAKVQSKITGRLLRKADLVDPSLKVQFDDIVRIYDRFSSESIYHIDLIGQKGVWHGSLSNICIANDSLIIFDATLFSTKDVVSWQKPLLSILIPIGRMLQNMRMRTFKRVSA